MLAKIAKIVLNYFYYRAKEKVEMEDIKWLLEAIENAGKTAIKEDGTYWRASYTREDKAVVDLLKGYMESMGMETFFDAVGNLHGVIRGSEGDTVMTGSHRDTVRNGGKYDGILGVLCSIRAAGSLYEELGSPRSSIEVVAMVEEESSRFTASDYIGSCNIAGIMPESAFSLTDDHGVTIQEAAVAAGYKGSPADSRRPDIKHFVELARSQLIISVIKRDIVLAAEVIDHSKQVKTFGVPLAFVQLAYFVTAQHITDKGKLALVFYKVADVAFEYFKRASFHVVFLRFAVFLILAQYLCDVKHWNNFA